MNNLAIRRSEIKDVENLTVLKQRVWIATYAVEGIRTEFSSYVLSPFTTESIRNLLLSQDMISLVAEVGNHIIGCVEIKLYPTTAIPEVMTILEITVLYVLERFCRRGIGQKLLNAACGFLREKQYPSVWLSVLHTNERALSFYRKNCFEDIGKIYFISLASFKS
ncbi:MAG: GNAT family N-acetyltransferase [Prevotellaceae bacterium]|jgi:ribosomal protein S18 acetylase RimI-like enzyme|nr:GNAT family N-acetyltransferase [Prevotellaceae bacterium]